MSDTASKEDLKWMDLALAEAGKGLGKTSPNPPVGAVLTRSGSVLAQGHHRRAGGPHAEIEAIRQAGDDLEGATLYVTLEPCSTHGRTPPCVEAILQAGIARVVFGTVDPNPAHAGKGLEQLRKAGVEVEGPLREEAARELIRFFRKRVTEGLPYVIAKTGMTLDGRITPADRETGWITGEAAREDVQRLRSEVDAILVGGQTVRADDPRLTLRGSHAEGREQPWRIVMTRGGDLPEKARIFTDEHRERTRVFHVEQMGTVLGKLAEEGICSVLLECGGTLMAEAFREGWVDEVCFYLAPTIGGGERRAVESFGFSSRLSRPEVEYFGSDLRLRARVQTKPGNECE